ncbi:uncharacterized protein [Typha angustifolia]|uniref:uncharacterized protein n=1 Tax=Typha angustifolia TaxID=59011 RepID=UPI003C2F9E8A
MTNSEEEEDEEEEFYESLDRILSSSCSSTSASDDESGDHHRRRQSQHLPLFPPASAASLDVWIAEPAPVEERRRRLLEQMGLDGDPALARVGSPKPLPGGGGDHWVMTVRDGEMGRSVSCDGLRPSLASSSSSSSSAAAASVVRSRSDSAVDPNPGHRPILQPISSKPPLVGRPKSDGNLDVSEEDGEDDPRFLIKDLDNGKEFVVKELREDGMWNKLREVGTGRQLSMEEFEMCVGRSPIVQELMRRQNVENSASVGGGSSCEGHDVSAKSSKKKGSWFRSIKNIAGHRERRSSDERDTSSEKGGRRSSSATDDSQEATNSLHIGPEMVKVRQYGKSHKELSGLYMSQEIQAHSGSIWSIKFSLDGRFLATAGQDCVIHVWEVSELERKGEILAERPVEENGNCNPFVAAVINGSPEPTFGLSSVEGSHLEKKRRAKVHGSRKSVSLDHLMVPEHVFALSEKPVCSFRGHLDDVLDLSWSKSQYLLSSSMDKTVRLWHMSTNSCLKMFSHSDYVTCIQFNPVDDRYFISGSLDEKVRIWSIPDRQIVDWNDLHEMVTAACYAPDGKSALVGSHKGSCHLYDTSDNKLVQKSQIDLQNKKKKSNHKKITGFQFAPKSSSKVLVTSADSRIRIIDSVELIHKIKGFRNTSSQISGYFTTNGKYVICASEDSHVYVWRYDDDSRPSRSRAVTMSQSYEHFHCQDVTVAIPWPTSGTGGTPRSHSRRQDVQDGDFKYSPLVLTEANGQQHPPSPSSSPTHLPVNCLQQNSILDINSDNFAERFAATWPEELVAVKKQSPQSSFDVFDGSVPAESRSAWGLVIVTAGRGGEIRTFQNFGFPVRV